ncbi:MAG: VWA domain-containing protein, partial [Fibrobacteraceae bacterium]
VESGKQGRTYPSGDVYVAPGSDTLIYAVPYGGYTFNSWDSIAGSMTISNLKNSRTRISPKTSLCSVRATYVLDFTVEPSLLISNLDLSGYPGICTQVSVTDKNNGRSIFGLDSSNFILFQDKQSLPLQATTIQEISGVSVVLVADESGSMSGTRLVEAKESMRAFIREMGPYDRTAIVGFSGGSDASVKQVMTSDTSLLMKAVDKLTASGMTNINTGAILGVNQIVGETNPTAVIIFSDGLNNDDVTDSYSVITLANTLNTSIYSIGLENTDTDPLLYLAEGTGGTYSYAPSGDELASIYATIRSAVQARYVLCYQSPDAVLDGDTHTVVIKTNFLGKNASDTATWQEDFLPPSVRLTEETWNKVGKNQPQKDTLSISVYATSKIPITSVMLYIRKSSTTNAAFSAYSMVHVKDSLWRYIVPASSVLYPGLDFYVVATDSSGFIGKTPAIPTPSKEPYTIPIKNEVPNIELLTLSCSDTIGGSGNILFNITDDDGIYSATIYYKDSLSVLFLEQKITRKSDTSDTWIASIPAEIFQSGEIEYYVRALDTNGASARWLKTKNSTISACKDGDTAPDIKDIITIKNGDSANSAIVRSTKGIGITLLSQDFTPKTDTLKASLSCLVSGDKEDIRLIEKNSGYYETLKHISKNEYSAKKNDGYISCAANDTLIAEFKDPVYSTISRDTVAFKDSVAYSYRFLETDSIADLDSIETSTSAAFRLRLTATSPTLYKADTLEVLFFTNKGDSLWVKAVETAPYSSIFDCTEKFYFAENQSAIKESHLDAVLSLEISNNRVKIQAQIGSDTSSLKSRDSLIIFSNYIPADVAEIYDRDLDGRADSVRIHFVKPLKQKISSIDTVFWNVAGGARQKVPSKNIRIVGDSSWIEGLLEKPFEYGLTAANKTNQPYLRVTKKDSDLSQKVLLNDKIGAVPIEAEKHPGKASLNSYLEPSTGIPPDTLIVTLSEKIQDSTNGNSWNTLFQYSPTCEDSATYPLKLLKAPELDKSGMNWILILKDYSAITGNCIRLNPSAPYKDYYKNNPDRGGVEIKGANGAMYLYDIAANPPISGTGKTSKWIPPEESSLQDVPDSISTVKVLSAAPYTAEIFIYDGLANFVISMTQKFGYHGEMEDTLRGNSENRAKIGYLYWNQRSDAGRKVGNGVYIWRIVFKFEDGHSEYRLLKTGILRKEK